MKLMKTCQGTIVLEYPRYLVAAALSIAGKHQQQISAMFPTPWNQIEATLAFNQNIPVLVIAHEGISGGVFDYGVTREYVHTAKLNRKGWYKEKKFRGIFQ